MNTIANDEAPVLGKIYMATLHTDNFQTMHDFYSEKLGMKVVFEQKGFVEFDSNGLRLSLASRKRQKFQF